MTTPLHVLLALTTKGLELYRLSCTSNTRIRFGISNRQLEVVLHGLSKRGFTIGELEIVELPDDLMNATRGQYRSKYLLGLGRDRAKEMSDWHTKVLVITDADMYDVGTHYVVGQAEVDGRAAVVSLTRIRAGDEKRFLRRLITESLHELGHTLGLGHCPEKNCVMYSSKKLPDSDIKSQDLCERCNVKVGRAMERA